MLLFLFGKKPQGDSREFIFPAHFEKMVEAFEQVRKSNPMIMAPTNKRNKRQPSLKMITGGSPRFKEDAELSEPPPRDEENEEESKLELHRGLSERSHNHHGDLSPVPLSPYSVVSRGNMRRLDDESWEQYLSRMNHSDCSEF